MTVILFYNYFLVGGVWFWGLFIFLFVLYYDMFVEIEVFWGGWCLNYWEWVGVLF